MPIFVLPELGAAFARAGLVLAPWSRLAMLEEQILRRVRSAFLVHWFGTGVPTIGVDLHVEIENIEALRRRYLEVRRSVRQAGPELNLLGPLSGIAGLIVGMALSPTGFILIAPRVRRIAGLLMDGPWRGIVPWLYWIFGAWLVPALVVGVGMPFAFAGALTAALGDSGSARGVYLLLGEMAMLIDAIVRFWDLLTGPRSAIRNPLLRRILHVFDRIAGLFAHVLGFVALLVTRIARLLPWLMGQFRAFAGLADEVLVTLQGIFGDVVETLRAPFAARGGLTAIIERVLATIVALPQTLMQTMSALIDNLIGQVTTALDTITRTIETFVSGLRTRIVDAFRQTVVGLLVGRIERLMAIVPALRAAHAAAQASRRPAPTEPPPSEFVQGLGFVLTGGLWGSIGGIQSSLGELFGSMRRTPIPPLPPIAVPPLPAAPPMASLDDVMTRIGRPTLDPAALSTRLGAEAEAALGRPDTAGILRDPASVFERERRALEQTMPPPQLQLDDERLRDLIYIAVGRVLPPALRPNAPSVRALFDMVDEQVYGVERQPLEHPMLDLAGSDRLRPVVHMLTVRSFGGFEPDVRGFRDLVVEELNARTYVAAPAP